MGLYIEENYRGVETGKDGKEKRSGCGDSGIYECRYDTPSEVYKFCLKEWGKCVSKVYIDMPDGKTQHIGWVFVKRVPYEDTPKKTYLREVWVTLHEKPPERTTEYHYYNIS